VRAERGGGDLGDLGGGDLEAGERLTATRDLVGEWLLLRLLDRDLE